MRKSFKGFTLIECLVALAILGLASLTMAQIYASVSARNKMNHLVNTSLSNQMAYVEKYTNTDAVPIYFGDIGHTGVSASDPNYSSTDRKPPHVSHPSADNRYPSDPQYPSIKIESTYAIKDKPTGTSGKNNYSYAADIYVLKSRDRDNNTLDTSTRDAGYTEADYNLRYKYILGHNN